MRNSDPAQARAGHERPQYEGARVALQRALPFLTPTNPKDTVPKSHPCLRPSVLPCALLIAAACLPAMPADGHPAASTAPAATVAANVYRIDPHSGDDAHPPGKPWRTFARLNAVRLCPGDTVLIAAGKHVGTLSPVGEGTAEQPITLRFLPGVHTLGGAELLRTPLFVSNSQDSTEPKTVGVCLRGLRYLRIEGGGIEGVGKTTLLYDGRMVQLLSEQVEDLVVSGLVFDLARPTVSEFRVLNVGGTTARIEVAEGSDYAIEDGRFLWKGDWGTGRLLCQEAVPAEGRSWRSKTPRGWTNTGQVEAKATDAGGRKVLLEYPGAEPGLVVDRTYQFRQTKRDSVGVFTSRCRRVVFRDCTFNALTNMGFVSQFTDTMTFQRVNVAPPPHSLRTCAAWADIFQFSNCRGDLLVEDCRLSGMQDDAINVHGTHLRIVGRPAERQLLVRFMHPQTYGFAAFAEGDEVAVINHARLREYEGNPRRRVSAVERRSEKEWLLTLDGPAPSFQENDVVDNVTWHPNLTARRNRVSLSPVRGFLITTRGRVLIEDNVFERCAMPAILVENDAEGWFESGPVRDLWIRRNRFVGSGIVISPRVKRPAADEPVHENIRIEDNLFENLGRGVPAVAARCVKGLVVAGNRTTPHEWNVAIDASCTDTRVERNGRATD